MVCTHSSCSHQRFPRTCHPPVATSCCTVQVHLQDCSWAGRQHQCRTQWRHIIAANSRAYRSRRRVGSFSSWCCRSPRSRVCGCGTRQWWGWPPRKPCGRQRLGTQPQSNSQGIGAAAWAFQAVRPSATAALRVPAAAAVAVGAPASEGAGAVPAGGGADEPRTRGFTRRGATAVEQQYKRMPESP